LLGLGLGVALAAGCKENKGEMAMTSSPSASLAYESPTPDYYGPGSLNPPNGSAQGTSSEYDVYTPDDGSSTTQYAAAGQPQAQTSAYSNYAAPAQSTAQRGGRHVVVKGDTLYSLARTYYNGDMSKWRDIYAANRSTLRDPNRLRVGQELIIP
jgi:5'-nucleotidase